MENFKITVWKLNSKGREQIIDCQNFKTRIDAETFISNYKLEPKPYKMAKNIKYQTTEL